ncbi:hypothetical protein VE01_00965 [Pseudogymnoascus verrucosus]|uniref:A1 cistron-splicing factor n=1 Tax=Pseudogymnoascus verrucosus TaxID=342668 RepID=A0A2P2SWQ9_9PEZI|nr:uncharacterized protein VE01_00965 [Pseudogymnoascus verrucosus]OBU01234.1 hypothetical protein VE01_00965 [Pseudogymnoascus verrucosus]
MASNNKDSSSQNESNHRQQHLTRPIALPLRPLPRSGRSPGTGTAPRADASTGDLSGSPMNSLQLHAGNSREEYGSSQYLQAGDVVIIAGVPPGSFIGYDTVGLNIEKNHHFGGVRELPPGPHFVYGGSMSEISTRNGFWIISNQRQPGEPGEVFVKKWDRNTETLEDEDSAVETRRQKDNIHSSYGTLLPYDVRAAQTPELSKSRGNPAEAHGDDPRTWQDLTFAIKGPMLSRVIGGTWNNWKVTSMDEPKSTDTKPADNQHQMAMGIVPAPNPVDVAIAEEKKLGFIFPAGSKTYSETAIGRARSEQAMDSSSHVRGVIAESCTSDGPNDVLGELQFCYLTGVLLSNLCCMEQWGHVVKILFKAFRFAVEEAHFFAKVIEVFHSQLVYDDEYLQGSIFDHSNHLQDELKVELTIFKSRLTEQLSSKPDGLSREENELKAAFGRLESWLSKWGWDLGGNYLRVGKIQLEDGEYVDAEMEDLEAEDERGEYAPVMVELDEGGREKGTIGW